MRTPLLLEARAHRAKPQPLVSCPALPVHPPKVLSARRNTTVKSCCSFLSLALWRGCELPPPPQAGAQQSSVLVTHILFVTVAGNVPCCHLTAPKCALTLLGGHHLFTLSGVSGLFKLLQPFHTRRKCLYPKLWQINLSYQKESHLWTVKLQ